MFRSSAVIVVATALAAGCSSPVVVVAVQNPQALPITKEHVRLDWTGAHGETRSTTHDFAINGNLGTFTVELAHVSGGRLRIAADFADSTGAPVGRATATLALTGASRTDVSLRATRLLSGTTTLLAGVPGGAGDRDGSTGPGATQVARFDQPIAFATVGFQMPTFGTAGFVLEACGAIRRVTAPGGSSFVTEPFVPCSRHAPNADVGLASDVSINEPIAMVGDLDTGFLYVADGNRVLRFDLPTADAPPDQVSYVDFTGLTGVTPKHISDITLGDYRQNTVATPPYSRLYVADDVANQVWSYPLDPQTGAPTVAAGAGGPCVMPLPAAEQPPTGGQAATWVAPTAAHLCRPNRLGTGALDASGSPSALFISDAGNGAMRALGPNGVTTLFAGFPKGVSAFAYRFLSATSSPISGIEVGALFFFSDSQLWFYLTNASPAIPGLGSAVQLTSNPTPGFTEDWNILTAFGDTPPGPEVQFDDVSQVVRIADGEDTNPLIANSYLIFVQRGNSVVDHVATNIGSSGQRQPLDVEPWLGTGPHRGQDRLPSQPDLPPAAFAGPLGLAWDASSGLYVADHDNHTVAHVGYDGTTLPLRMPSPLPLVGCPGSPGHVDGAAADARLRDPAALALDASAGALYVLDSDGTAVRRVTLAGVDGATEVHTLFSADASDGAACDGGVLDAGVTPPGLLGKMSSLAFDPVRRVLWAAHADTPDLAFFAVDAADPTPQLVPLPGGSDGGGQLALADRTLYALDAAGHLSAIDLLDDEPAPRAAANLPLGGAVTAFGSDGEWLYVADDGAQLWRVDPQDPSFAASQLGGDGRHGVVLGATPGFNRIGGIGYDGARGVLLVSDAAENAIIALQ